MAQENIIVDITGAGIGVHDVTYDPATNILTIIYDDGSEKDIQLTDVFLEDVTLVGSELLFTMNDGTIITQSLESFDQIQSDWDETDTGLASFILNKPPTESNLSQTATAITIVVANDNGTGITIPAATTDAAGVMTADQFDKLAAVNLGAEENVQSDWTETSGAEDSFILNKPPQATLVLTGNDLVYTDQEGSATSIDLSVYIDAELVAGQYLHATKMLEFTKDDGETFLIDVTGLADWPDGEIPADKLPWATQAEADAGILADKVIAPLTMHKKIEADDYGTGTIGGTAKFHLDVTTATLYITTDGTDAG